MTKKIKKITLLVGMILFCTMMSTASLTYAATPTPMTDYIGKPSGADHFGPVVAKVKGWISDAFIATQIIGWGTVAIAGVVAFICFGIFKDAQAVREHKQWLLRIVISAAGIGLVTGIIGIVASLS